MDSRMIRMTVAAALCAVAGTLSAATEYFVDCNRPDDSGDGLTEATAKRTIQAAIDLTNPKGKDTVTVLPGVYSNGVRHVTAVSDDDFRVVITNHCVLRSRDGAAKTIIKGEFGSGDNKQGEGAVRGVFMSGVNYAVVEGFTITGCATRYTAPDGNKHYGAAVVGNWNNYVLGCVISNNYAYTGAGTYTVNAIRCLIADNGAKSCTVGVNSYYFNCVITRNLGGESPLGYAKALVNCTCVDNPGTLFNSSSTNIYNSVLTLSTGVGLSGFTELHACVTDDAESKFKSVDAQTVCSASKYQHVAPVFGDWRLKSDSDARGIASLADYKTYLNTNQKFRYSCTDGKWNPQWVLDRYELKDFAGNDMTETLDAGAIQGGVTVASGPVDFSVGFCGRDWTVPSGNSYAFTETWPDTVFCRHVPTTAYPSFHCITEGSYGKVYHYPTPDGLYAFAAPPPEGSVSATGYAAQSVYYVSDEDGDDDNNDGKGRDRPFQTLQRAYDEAKGNYNYVIVAPGTYDKGGRPADGSVLTNRLYCADNKSIQFVAESGPDVTFIKGAADSESTMLGLGRAAVRCVRWYSSHNEAAMRGFTLTDGHTAAEGVTAPSSWTPVESNMGGAVYVTNEGAGKVQFLDCVFSNNFAHMAAVNHQGTFTRCRFVGNKANNPSGSIGRNATYRFCEFRDNIEQNFTLDNSVQYLYFCSVRGKVAPMQSDIYASLLVGMAGVSAENLAVTKAHEFDGNLVNGATVTQAAGGTGAFSYISDDAKLVAPTSGDLRFRADSPAVGGASIANLTALLGQVTADLEGHGLYVKDGVPAIGAHQWPVQAFVVAGPKDSVTVTGGNVGTNYLEAGESVIVTAAPTRKGAEFLGWTVDGVELPYEGLDYAYTVPDDPDQTMPTILARYAKPGFMLLLR